MSVGSDSALRELLTQAQKAASAYQAAQRDDLPEQEARWLRQGADEHQQNVRLLTPHIESVLASREGTAWASAVATGKAKVASWLGTSQMLANLVAAEDELSAALEAALKVASLPVELKALCEDQRACARTRLGHLRQREKAAAHPSATNDENVSGPLGHRGDTLNKPAQTSSESSDC